MISRVVLCLALITVVSAENITKWEFNYKLCGDERITMIYDLPADLSGSYWLRIELLKDPKNIYVLFNPRFNKQHTVCNSMKNGSWGTEQITKGDFPFKPGQQYRIDMQVVKDAIVVSVNGKQYLTFVSPMQPLSDCHYIQTYNSEVTDIYKVGTHC